MDIGGGAGAVGAAGAGALGVEPPFIDNSRNRDASRILVNSLGPATGGAAGVTAGALGAT
jgi:hypothetical protein